MASFFIFPIINHQEEAEATAGVAEVPTIAMVVGKEKASVDITPTSATGSFAASNNDTHSEFSVSTSNYTGYTLSIKASDDAGQLVNASYGETLDSISSPVDANTFETGAAGTYTNKWGYKPNYYNSAANTDFLPAPTTAESTLDATSTAATKNYSIDVAARVDYTKPSGTYTNTYVLTATANPVAYVINYVDSTGGEATNMPTIPQSGSVGTTSVVLAPTYSTGSAPNRSTFTFKKWCLGTVNSTESYNSTNKVYNRPATICTGTELATGDSITLDPATSNNITLYAVWTPTTFAQAYTAAGTTAATKLNGYYQMQNMSKTICAAVTIGQYATLIDNRDNNTYLVGKLNDNRCWLEENLRLDLNQSSIVNKLTTANTHVDSTSLNYLKNGGGSGRYAAAAITGNASGTSFTNPLVYPTSGQIWASDKDSSYPSTFSGTYSSTTVLSTLTSDSAFGPGSGKMGIYYNYCAATAGNYCYTNASVQTVASATADICPKNWKLPSSLASTSDTQKLCDAVRGSTCEDNTSVMSRSSTSSLQFKLSLLFSGFYNSTHIGLAGAGGIFWSSDSVITDGEGTGNAALVIGVTAGSSGPTNWVRIRSKNWRANGKNIRCIAQY